MLFLYVFMIILKFDWCFFAYRSCIQWFLHKCLVPNTHNQRWLSLAVSGIGKLISRKTSITVGYSQHLFCYRFFGTRVQTSCAVSFAGSRPEGRMAWLLSIAKHNSSSNIICVQTTTQTGRQVSSPLSWADSSRRRGWWLMGVRWAKRAQSHKPVVVAGAKHTAWHGKAQVVGWMDTYRLDVSGREQPVACETWRISVVQLSEVTAIG